MIFIIKSITDMHSLAIRRRVNQKLTIFNV